MDIRMRARTRAVIAILAALTALLGFSALQPSNAHAVVESVAVTANQTGWVKTRDQTLMCVRAPCPGSTISAYRWQSYAYPYANYGYWQEVRVPVSTDVYVTPYATGWHWARTARSSWFVIKTSELVTTRRCPPGMMCAL